MKVISKILVLIFFLANVVFSQEKIFPQPQIAFDPKSYLCYRTNTTINIDGKIDEPVWSNVEWTDYFVDIEGNLKPLPRFNTRAKMLWDEKYFYIASELEEPNLWATLKQRDTVIFYDNDFEIFIDPDGDTYNYYELEINAFKTAWDLLLTKPYRDANGKQVAFNSWDINGLKVGVELIGTINNPNDIDNGWTCEIAIPWSALKENYTNKIQPKPGEQWRINFSRVEWKLKVINGRYEKEINPVTGKSYPEDNWVWSPQGLIAMHYPEMWGYVQFSDKIAGEQIDNFQIQHDELLKWAMRNIYYAEKTFYLNNKFYTSDLKKLFLPELKNDGYSWPPVLESTTNTFEARSKSGNKQHLISINEDGEIKIELLKQKE